MVGTQRAVTASCQSCGQPFTPQRRSARFCSPACRVAAHRARLSVTGAAPRGGTACALKPARGTSGASPRSGDAAGEITVTLRTEGIVPDPLWPSMWRIKFADGRLSDMVNLTRAKDRWKAQHRPTCSKTSLLLERCASLNG